MSDKKEVNKSEEIRKIAAAMKGKGEKPRPVVIIAMLKKQGITVSSPQVSMVLKGMGFKPRKRAKAVAGGSRTSGKVAVTVEDLVAAKKLVHQFGSADRAIRAIEALKQFS